MCEDRSAGTSTVDAQPSQLPYTDGTRSGLGMPKFYTHAKPARPPCLSPSSPCATPRCASASPNPPSATRGKILRRPTQEWNKSVAPSTRPTSATRRHRSGRGGQTSADASNARSPPCRRTKRLSGRGSSTSDTSDGGARRSSSASINAWSERWRF